MSESLNLPADTKAHIPLGHTPPPARPQIVVPNEPTAWNSHSKQKHKTRGVSFAVKVNYNFETPSF